MKKKNKKFSLVYLFGIMVLLAGLITIVFPGMSMYRLATAKYRQDVESSVISVQVDDQWINYSDTYDISVDAKKWLTREEMIIDGEVFPYEGSYPSDPGGTITHTVISNDGVNWEVNDMDTFGIAANCFIGLLCIAAGCGIIVFESRR